MKATDGSSAAGPTLLETLWEEMDVSYERLVNEEKPKQRELADALEDGVSSETSMSTAASFALEWQAYGEARGKCAGLAYAIAVITNPYETNLPAIKREAKRRYQEANK